MFPARRWTDVAAASRRRRRARPASRAASARRALGARRVVVAADAGASGCERLTFAEDVEVAEARARRLRVDGRAALLVVGDSGTDGAYVLVDADHRASGSSAAIAVIHGAGRRPRSSADGDAVGRDLGG